MRSRAFGVEHPAIQGSAFGLGPTDSIQVAIVLLFKVGHLR